MPHENHYRSLLVTELAPILAFPVENAAMIGTPDVCTLLGWIEVKKAHDVARPTTTVRVEFQPGQRHWMKQWCRYGGLGWYLTRLAAPGEHSATWLLHRGAWGTEHLGEVDRKTLLDAAVMVRGVVAGVPPGSEIVRAMQNARRTA